MKVTEDWIIRLAAKNSLQLNRKKNSYGSKMILGIGDDGAVIEKNRSYVDVHCTDSMVEGTHFLWHQIRPEELAYKILAVNLSDCLVMGCRAQYALLNFGVDKRATREWIQRFYRSLRRHCRVAQIKLLGGDTFLSEKKAIVSMTVWGETQKSKLKLRSGAKSGDLICVVGRLGGSRAGLVDLQKGIKDSPFRSSHFRPKIYQDEAIFLAGSPAVHCMMDISDGLAVDLPRLARASRVAYEIELQKLPLAIDLKDWALKNGKDPYVFAFEGGEDYAILCAIDAKSSSSLQKEFKKRFGHQIGIIGSIHSGKQPKVFLQGERYLKSHASFHHFR